MAFPDLKSERDQILRIDIDILKLHDEMGAVVLLGEIDTAHDLLRCKAAVLRCYNEFCLHVIIPVDDADYFANKLFNRLINA